MRKPSMRNPRKQVKNNSNTKTIIVVLSFVLVLVLASVLYNVLKSNNDSDSTKQNSSIAKDFSVVDKNGKTVKLSDYFGKPIVLNFWASWCPPCRGEMPYFNEIYNKEKGNVTFIMVDLVDGERETVEIGKKFIKSQGFSFPVYFDVNGEAAKTYYLSSIPQTVFIDKKGNIVNQKVGGIEEQELIDNINSIKK